MSENTETPFASGICSWHCEDNLR